MGRILFEYQALVLEQSDRAVEVEAFEEQLRACSRRGLSSHLHRQGLVAVRTAEASVSRRLVDDRHEPERTVEGGRALEIRDNQGDVIQSHFPAWAVYFVAGSPLGRPIRRRRSWNRGSDRSGSKTGRSRME